MSAAICCMTAFLCFSLKVSGQESSTSTEELVSPALGLSSNLHTTSDAARRQRSALIIAFFLELVCAGMSAADGACSTHDSVMVIAFLYNSIEDVRPGLQCIGDEAKFVST